MKIKKTGVPVDKFYIYAYLDTRKPGNYFYKKGKLEFNFNFEPFYIGKGCGRRMRAHLYEKEASGIQCNSHKIRKIQKIIKETNEEPQIIIIRNQLTENDAGILEKIYINTIGREDLKNGPLTNKTDGGDGATNASSMIKPIYQFSLNGAFIKEWISITNAAKSIKTDVSNISSCLLKKSKTASGYLWFYKKDFKEKVPLNLDSEIVKELTISQADKYKKSVVQFSINGEFIKTWDSLSEASNKNKLSLTSISNVCLRIKGHNTVGGCLWFYRSHFKKIPKKLNSNFLRNLISRKILTKKVNQYSKDGFLIKTWNSIKEASEHTKIHRGSIGSVSSDNKKNKTAGGFIWKFEGVQANKILVSEKINQFSINGAFIKTWDSLAEIKKAFKCKRHPIMKTCQKERLTAYNFIWRFGNCFKVLPGELKIKKPKLIQLSKNNKIIKIWDTLIMAAKNLNIDRSSISRAASLKYSTKTAGGFIWKFLY